MYLREESQAPSGTYSSVPMSQYPSTTSSGHRHTNSTSSHVSQGSRTSSRRDHYYHNPAVESAVTRLLVAIKQLLESLTQWSTGRMREKEVSDVYVRLGNDFNAAVAAFSQFNIDMSELMSVPDDLRTILETCLSEEASPAILDIYLPDVRKIITNLLQGLRSKQSVYRRTVSDMSRQSTSSSQGDSPRIRDSRASTRSGTDRHRSVPRERDGRQSTSSRRKDSISESQARTPAPGEETEWAGDYSPSSASSGGNMTFVPNERAHPSGPPVRRHQSATSSNQASVQRDLPPPAEEDETTTPQDEPSTEAPIPVHQAPPNLIRYSLTDRPVPPSSAAPPQVTRPSIVSDEASAIAVDNRFTVTDYDQQAITDSAGTTSSHGGAEQDIEAPMDPMGAPAMESSLAALKKSDALERRASKRFSTYTFSKMTGTRDKGLSALDKLVGGEERRRNRRSAALGGNLTPGDLESLAEEHESPSKPSKRIRGSRTDSSSTGSSKASRIHTPEEPPPVPPIPGSVTPTAISRPLSEAEPLPPDVTDVPAPPTSTDRLSSELLTPSLPTVTVFLKVGLQVKKVTLEREGLSIPSLRLQFTEKFSYNPGMDNFPAIYINDPTSHIQYELEDMDEIKEKSLLSLNIEPLDQIKQHIDLQISVLSQDIKDLKSTVGSNRRQSIPPQAPPMAVTQMPVARPSEGQFVNMAKRVAARLSRVQAEEGSPQPTLVASDEVIRRSQSPQPLSSILPQQTGSSSNVSDVASYRIVSDLKTQFDEVQNLRRDLGVMRQLYGDFMNQTKGSLSTLRAQTATVRQLASAKVGGARTYIDSGKANLDMRSQNVLTKVEELQDTVETLKHDVIKRHIQPRPNIMRTLKADIEATAKELESLTERIQTVKPMWKKTWEEELQNIVEEQQFLSHQEEFMDDLLEDHKALSEVYGHIEKVISIRGTTGSTRSRTPFRPPPMEEGHNGLSTVMLEIRGAAVDPERRLKAIAMNQKNREKELASRSDEFQAELNGFVQGKKLKMTGGAEEVERIRQKRNDMTLKQMFSGGTTPSTAMAQGDPSSPNS